MPGLVLYNRRWSLGSDDILIPAVFLTIVHTSWLVTLTLVLAEAKLDGEEECQVRYWELLVGHIVIWSGSLVLELCMLVVSLRGSVADDGPRAGMRYLVYIKQGLLGVELVWMGVAIVWLLRYFPLSPSCHLGHKESSLVLALVLSCIAVTAVLLVIGWCAWDVAGRSWLKLKKYQQNSQQSSERADRCSGAYKRSGGARNWRHRKVRRAYQNSWDNRCKLFFCCSLGRNRKIKSSFAEIAALLSEFFRDLDVVPTDVLVGLLLLRQRQQQVRQRIISQPTNNVYDFLSGVKVTPDTKFVALNKPEELAELRRTVHYMYFALGAYGWPMYLLQNKTVPGCLAGWRLASTLSCCCLPSSKCCSPKQEEEGEAKEGLTIVEDNCCGCNFAALKQVCSQETVEMVYVTYHVDVGETPFFIGVDYDMGKIVISIRGTLSMKDIMTDLNAESELLPLQPLQEEWKGHKGMVQAAEYIHDKLVQERLLEKAFTWKKEKGTDKFPLVCVGHSLGGGTAAILAIILRQQYPDVTCYAYSPPGGLLSEEAMLASRTFMTSVVVGKDVVPRIGMHQLETLRYDMMEAVKRSPHSKWRTIAQTVSCCYTRPQDGDQDIYKDESPTAAINVHPMDCSVNLSVHQPLYPPGKIIHIVRHHPDRSKRRSSPVYQAVWADNKDFDQVLISKRMIQDHMPDNVLDALEKASSIHAWHTVSTFQDRSSMYQKVTECLIPDPEVGEIVEHRQEHSQLLETHLEFNESTLKLSEKVLCNNTEVREEMSHTHTVTETNTGEEGPHTDTDRTSVYLDPVPAPLASPELISEDSSVCSRNSLQARDQIQTRLRAGLINSVTREEENIVVYESSSQERKCLSPRSLSKSVKFQFQSPDESVPSPSSARKISILKNHQSVCDTQECCAAPQTVIPDSCSSPPPPGVSSLVQTRKDILSFYDISNQGFTVV